MDTKQSDGRHDSHGVGVAIGGLMIAAVLVAGFAAAIAPSKALALIEGQSAKVWLAAILAVCIVRLGWSVVQFFFLPNSRRFLIIFAGPLIAACVAASQSPAILAAVQSAKVEVDLTEEGAKANAHLKSGKYDWSSTCATLGSLAIAGVILVVISSKYSEQCQRAGTV